MEGDYLSLYEHKRLCLAHAMVKSLRGYSVPENPLKLAGGLRSEVNVRSELPGYS